ncbi:MAG: hypothetical protein GX243_05375, partial [Tissierellia bacterium]|nr:hypothetical protein [Tissierellia bacterium]
MFFNYIEKNINKKQKIMKEKRRFSKSIATFGLLLILFFICFLLGGCSQTNNKRLERDSDREFDNGSGIYFYSISEEKTSDLAKLCKVWGLAKYYHPEVVSGNINWDYELFRVMPHVLEEGADVNSILYQWIHSFDSGISIGSKERQYQIPQDIIQLRPSTDWCRDEKYLG